MNDIVFATASELGAAIRTRQISASEVVDAFESQIAKHNPQLNAIVTLDIEGTRQRAREADRALDTGELWGPLHGVPVTLKDTFETAGMRTTSSYKPLADYVPAQDATVVARLRQAGAIILGKTNMPQLAGDTQSHSPLGRIVTGFIGHVQQIGLTVDLSRDRGDNRWTRGHLHQLDVRAPTIGDRFEIIAQPEG